MGLAIVHRRPATRAPLLPPAPPRTPASAAAPPARRGLGARPLRGVGIDGRAVNMLGTEATAAHVGRGALVRDIAPRPLAGVKRLLPSLAEAAEAVRVLVPRAAAAGRLARLPPDDLRLVVRVRVVIG
eukprot:scaffold40680_cov60-Phaeocystis_antarctica.AAC.3